MIRIADIISGSPGKDLPDKDKEKKEPPKETNPPPNVELIKTQSEDSSKIPGPSLTAHIPAREPSLMELSKSMLDKVKLESSQETKTLYNSLTDSLKHNCKTLLVAGNINLDALKDNLSAVIDQIALGNEEFIILTNSPSSSDYIYNHMVNVSMLSIILGKQIGFNKSRLLELSLGSLFHDVGLLEFEQLIYAPRKLTPEEYEQIKKHPILGRQILEKQKSFSTQILAIVSQHHERLDGTGYPNNLKGDKIDEYSKIVSLVNNYESLTHKRPFREKILNDQAIRMMVEQKTAFNSLYLKLFIEAVSIYPLSSWVKLSSGETAKVVGTNRYSLLKPTVKIYLDKQNKRVEAEHIIDLSKQPNVYVKAQIPEESVESKAKG
jgi:HD-GYP domain-containing protein (c-di-GMP phosphodiesterase class II)